MFVSCRPSVTPSQMVVGSVGSPDGGRANLPIRFMSSLLVEPAPPTSYRSVLEVRMPPFFLPIPRLGCKDSSSEC